MGLEESIDELVRRWALIANLGRTARIVGPRNARPHIEDASRTCPPTPSPVLYTEKEQETFFVRINNSTRVLQGSEIAKYRASRWPPSERE